MFQAVIREMNKAFRRGLLLHKTVSVWRQEMLYHQRMWEATLRAEWQDRFMEVVYELNDLFEGRMWFENAWGGYDPCWAIWGNGPGWRFFLHHCCSTNTLTLPCPSNYPGTCSECSDGWHAANASRATWTEAQDTASTAPQWGNHEQPSPWR